MARACGVREALNVIDPEPLADGVPTRVGRDRGREHAHHQQHECRARERMQRLEHGEAATRGRIGEQPGRDQHGADQPLRPERGDHGGIEHRERVAIGPAAHERVRGKQCRGREEHQQRVHHDRVRRPHELRARREPGGRHEPDRGREHGASPIEHEQQRRERGRGAHGARGGRRRPARERVRARDRPVVERRLLDEALIVQRRHDSGREPHLAADLRLARLVRRPDVAAEPGEADYEQREKRDPGLRRRHAPISRPAARATTPDGPAP